LTGAPCSHEYRILQPGGQVRWVQGRVEGILDEQGRLAGLAGTVQDVSERKEAEQALRQAQASLLHSQKMEAAGRLASGLAHDFNNILLAIMLNSNLLGSRPDLDKESRRVLGQIYESAERAAHLTRRLLTFTRKHVASPRVLDLNALVEGLLPMLRRLLGEVAELRVALETRPCLVRADPGQLEQVLVNLLVNARDATPRGGRVTLSTERVQRVLPPAEEAVPCVRLSVCDTGHGMSEDTLARLFEPFFTTKEPGKGTGLGLATVYGIVQESGGDIEVQSRPGQGATFSIYLPRQARAPSPAPAGGPDGPPPAGCETILVAEDEDQVRLALSRLLEGRGYRVLPAASGEEALRVSARYPGSIELLLTDVAMPEMGGVELARRLQALRPGLRVLLVSGHAPEVLARQGVEEGQPLLPKPFSPQALLQRVRESLNSGPGPPRVPEPAEVAADPVPREKS
ncbi:MAG TPA: ATP-binding protein, partial [Candidatus Nitrosotenuis sp.]|nr:ATP-binding protein [Candidatus Nitrosotenuis sp.]